MSKGLLRNRFIDEAGATANRRRLNETRIREATEVSRGTLNSRESRARRKAAAEAKASLKEMLEAGEGQ